jgi:hypothetical protein
MLDRSSRNTVNLRFQHHAQRLGIAAIAMCLASVPCMASTDSRAQEHGLLPQEFVDVLSYNIHGLFALAAKDNPRDRMPSIGWLSRPYEIVLYQEDFEYNSELARQLEHHAGFVGNGPAVGDPRRVITKIVSWPFTILIPRFSPPYGSGVSTFVSDNMDVYGSNSDHYDDCHGWFDASANCWSAKGYLRVSVETVSGAKIDVYNTHLEAGPGNESTRIRGKQLKALAKAIEKISGNRAVIVAGDFNLGYIRPGDRAIFNQFRDQLGLTDSGAGPETPFWRERDYILYRNGSETYLEVEEAGEALQFTSAGRSLSDHPALFARFEVLREQR